MDIEVKWDEGKCCHNGNCVRSLPDVFAVEDGHFIIRPENAPIVEVRRIIAACPSGALSEVAS